jgi:hypothetical protein
MWIRLLVTWRARNPSDHRIRRMIAMVRSMGFSLGSRQ